MAGGGLRPKSGEQARRRRGLGGEEARGSHGLPWEVFGGVGDGRWWVLGVEERAAAMAGGGEARRRWGEPMQQLVGPSGVGARDPRGRQGRRGAGRLGRRVRESEAEQSSVARCGSERRNGARQSG